MHLNITGQRVTKQGITAGRHLQRPVENIPAASRHKTNLNIINIFYQRIVTYDKYLAGGHW